MRSLILFGCLCAGCSSPVTPEPERAVFVSLQGSVSATGGARIAGARVRIVDGPNIGATTDTNASGDFSFQYLLAGNANLTANAGIYDEAVIGLNIDGSRRADFIFAVPSCQAQNTAQIAFRNISTTTAQDMEWDGVLLVTLAPGTLSRTYTFTAGVTHTLRALVAGTSTLACQVAQPILPQCDRGHTLECSGP